MHLKNRTFKEKNRNPVCILFSSFWSLLRTPTNKNELESEQEMIWKEFKCYNK